MKSKITELIFIIDKSGSMTGLEKDTIGDFNSMLEKQREEEGVCHISTVFFSDEAKVVHNRKNIAQVEPLTLKDYLPGGCTALLDTVGDAINHTVKIQKMLADDEKASKVMFVIITDGEENSSRRFNGAQIKKMISLEQEKYGWEFIFLGANIDAATTAERYGIRRERAANWIGNSKGVSKNFRALSAVVCNLRADNIDQNFDMQSFMDDLDDEQN